MNKLFSLIPLLLAMSACNQSAPSNDTAGMEAGSDAWEAALNAKDIDALVNMYSSDARLLPPDGEMTVGHDGVRAAFGAMIDAGLGGETTIVEATVAGDTGYIVGTFTLQAGDEVVGTGKYIETWRRGDDGQWLIANDIFNNDAAPKPQRQMMDMTHLMITHEVDNADHWMAAWTGENSRHKLFTDNGAMRVHTFRSADNPNLTGLVIGVRDMDALNAMLSSDEGQAAAVEDGVRMDTIVTLTESK
jgi:ketosteroid isomerase-like protein